MRDIRPISWLKGAHRDFGKFPTEVQRVALAALTMAAEGGKADSAKLFKGADGGVFEIALPFRSNAYRVIYAVQIGADVWVVDAFQKKSRTGIKTPQADVERIRERLKRLREALR